MPPAAARVVRNVQGLPVLELGGRVTPLISANQSSLHPPEDALWAPCFASGMELATLWVSAGGFYSEEYFPQYPAYRRLLRMGRFQPCRHQGLAQVAR